jgi:hypothetical protein
MPETIWVQATRGERVALWERDPRHPGGEVWVAGEAPQEVYPTPTVHRLLREGALTLVEAPQAPQDAPPAPEATPAATDTAAARVAPVEPAPPVQGGEPSAPAAKPTTRRK